MTEFVSDATLNEYEHFIETHPKGHFLQSRKWAAQKPDWKWYGLAFRRDGIICGAMSVLVRKIPFLPYTIMYSGRGPVCGTTDFEVVSALTDLVRELAKKTRAYVLKADPDVLSSDTAFSNLMQKAGYALCDTGKDFSGIQPRYVFRLNIENKTEEEVMSSFHSKTRYNIRLAERRGVEARLCGAEAVPDFSRIMTETGVRDSFQVRSPKYFENILKNLGENARLYMAYLDEKPIAGTIAIHYGDKVWYLYGASSNAYRDAMPNYLLQWEMIKWAVLEKCRIYDFRGVSGDLREDNPLYGLYRFKKGFNGDFCEFSGEFDLVFNKFIYHAVRISERVFRKLRKTLFVLRNK